MKIDYNKIPALTLQSIDAYVRDRVPPGGFLMAVLSNDLRMSFNRADSENIEAMFHIVAYLWNKCPADCWGSQEAVDAWLNPKPKDQKK